MKTIKDLQIAISFDPELIDEKDRKGVVGNLEESIWKYFHKFGVIIPNGTAVECGYGYEPIDVMYHIVDFKKETITFVVE